VTVATIDYRKDSLVAEGGTEELTRSRTQPFPPEISRRFPGNLTVLWRLPANAAGSLLLLQGGGESCPFGGTFYS
jgi:hypothetical protein